MGRGWFARRGNSPTALVDVRSLDEPDTPGVPEVGVSSDKDRVNRPCRLVDDPVDETEVPPPLGSHSIFRLARADGDRLILREDRAHVLNERQIAGPVRNPLSDVLVSELG